MATRKAFLLTLLAISCFTLVVSGCEWGGGNTEDDAGIHDGTDDDYPPPPYGTQYGEVVENFRVQETLCTAGTGMGRAIYMKDFLDAKATLVSVHAGWCGPCKTQAQTMEEDVYQVYKDRGLKILLLLYQTDTQSEDEQELLDYTCEYKEEHGMTFVVGIDPGAEVTSQYFRPTEAGTPLNMLLDQEMVIRYKVEGVIPDVLEGNIEAILSE
jgi:thiol-disulfide isomerase/thioredoxin